MKDINVFDEVNLKRRGFEGALYIHDIEDWGSHCLLQPSSAIKGASNGYNMEFESRFNPPANVHGRGPARISNKAGRWKWGELEGPDLVMVLDNVRAHARSMSDAGKNLNISLLATVNSFKSWDICSTCVCEERFFKGTAENLSKAAFPMRRQLGLSNRNGT